MPGVVELASISSLYERTIHDTGREPELIFLLAFLGTFAFIRTSAHMINAGVSWWPGNVNVGGTHIHHLVWGIWEKEGRRSIDAVIVVALLGLLGVLGFGAWVETANDITNGAFAAVGIVGAVALALALVTAAKGRLFLAAVAVIFWPVGVVGATRFAKPGSIWIRWVGTGTTRRPGT